MHRCIYVKFRETSVADAPNLGCSAEDDIRFVSWPPSPGGSRWTVRRRSIPQPSWLKYVFSRIPSFTPSPTPTRIAKVKAGHGLFGGAEIWVSGLFPHMADWMSTNGIDLQVARLELKELLCCPCCRIFETSTSNKCWVGVVESTIYLFSSIASGLWPHGFSQVPLDDFI